jgi:hypothetical protein
MRRKREKQAGRNDSFEVIQNIAENNQGDNNSYPGNKD